MSEFFAFTLGPETNPRLLADTETAPLLVGRFRAGVPPSSSVSSSSSSPAAAAASIPSASTPGGPAQLVPIRPAAPAPAPLPHRPWSPVSTAGGDALRATATTPWTGYGAVAATRVEEEDAEDEAETDAATDTDDADDTDDEEAANADRQTHPLLGTPREQPPPASPPSSSAGLLRRPRRCVRRAARRLHRHLRDLWLTPTSAAVGRAVDRWWTRWTLLVVLPAALAVAWCAVPLPQCPLGGGTEEAGRPPGHGAARVRVHFWFFLITYYGPYNVTALLWITKVFNLYSLNWWPTALGFPLSVSLLVALSLAVPAAAVQAARVILSSSPSPSSLPRLLARGLLALARRNTAWVTWTFAVMAMPVAAALVLLLLHERHLQLRHTSRLSATQRIFSPSALWLGEPAARRRRRQGSWWPWRRTGRGGGLRWGGWGARARAVAPPPANPDTDPLALAHEPSPQTPIPAPTQPPRYDVVYYYYAGTGARREDRLWYGRQGLPASFVRFLWLMGALFTSLLVYVLGEASASWFLAALPAMRHATVYAVAYVYGWTVTVFLLDALTGWILGGHQGERVGSYPLGWVFKLYFTLTYQTYVRALYVRLRSPSQFVYLQVLSSTTLVLVSPLLMSPWTHRLLAALRLNGQSYAAFQKVCVRNVFVRIVAENASMLAFLGSLLALHFGPNRAVYPYLAFADADADADNDPDNDGYTFSFTLYASSITWACELVAAYVVSGLIRYFYRLRVVAEGKRDLAAWPELLPTSVAVAVHVLQNMLFSIIRLRFC